MNSSFVTKSSLLARSSFLNLIDVKISFLKSLEVIRPASIKPDIILTGFDIGANLAAAVVGAHMNIHVAHIEGGEVSGTIDDSIRHATTKFAHLHFTSNKDATNRIIKMGENKKNVFTVGNPVLDNLKNIPKINPKILAKKYNLDRNSFSIIDIV